MKPATVTTGHEILGYKVVQHIGIVRGIVVRSRSVVGNFVAGLQTIAVDKTTEYRPANAFPDIFVSIERTARKARYSGQASKNKIYINILWWMKGVIWVCSPSSFRLRRPKRLTDVLSNFLPP